MSFSADKKLNFVQKIANLIYLLIASQAGLFRDAGFNTFLDGVSGKWVLELRETVWDTTKVPRFLIFSIR